MPSRFIFHFAEYRANPAAVVHAGVHNSSGKSWTPAGSALRAGQFKTRSAMSHMPFSRAPPPHKTMPPISAWAPAVALGWLIPGAGHLIQKRWIRGLLIMGSILSMFALGYAMQGRVYRPNGGDILDILGFVGDVGAGGLYILTRALDLGQGAIAHATADYGTKYIIVAGLLNFISVADAYHIAIGKKP